MSETPTSNGHLLEFLKAWIPVGAVIAGGVWAVYTYTDGQREQARAREVNAAREARAALVQAQQPFLERKMKLFFEASQLTGTLSHTPVGTKAWATAEDRFWTLYWGEMSIVEKGEVENWMAKFGARLKDHKAAPSEDTARDLAEASYHLAHALSEELREDWANPQIPARPAT